MPNVVTDTSGFITGSREVTLVNEQDEVLGAADIFAAHRYPPQLHRAPSVWLVNDNHQVLLQLRSPYKPIGAGWWGNAVCANVRPDEEYEACAHRRLAEEINVTGVKLQPLYKFHYQAYGNDNFGENEMDQVFLGQYQGEVNPNPDEVTDVVWLNIDELRTASASIEYPSAAETVATEWSILRSLTPPVEVELPHGTYLLTPWTFIIWQDPRFQAAIEQFA